MALHPLTGSERQPLPGAKSAGKADPAERLEVSVLLRRHGGDALAMHVKTLATQRHARTHMTREAFEQQFGADSSDIATVKKFATAHKLSVVQEHAGRRTVVLSGTVAQFNAAFGVDLQRFDHPGGSYRGRVGAIRLPTELQGVVEVVPGLDDRPAAFPGAPAARQHTLARLHRAWQPNGTKVASAIGRRSPGQARVCRAIWPGPLWHGPLWHGPLWHGALWPGPLWHGARLNQQRAGRLIHCSGQERVVCQMPDVLHSLMKLF